VCRLGGKSVADIMTPLEGASLSLSLSLVLALSLACIDLAWLADIYSLPSDTKLDHTAVDQILVSGHSRIPVHIPENKTDFVGMLSASSLSDLLASDESELTPMMAQSSRRYALGPSSSALAARARSDVSRPRSSSPTTPRTRSTSSHSFASPRLASS